MPNFAANLTMLYNEVDFLDRFAAAARDGFAGVEFLFPYAYPKDELAARLKEHKLDPGAAQPARRRLGRRRARHRLPSGSRRGVPRGRGQGHRVRHRPGLQAAELPGRQGPRGRARGRAAPDLRGQSALRRTGAGQGRHQAAGRAGQQPRHSGLLSEQVGAGDLDHGRGRLGQSLPAVRLLPYADHGRRSGDDLPPAAEPDRATSRSRTIRAATSPARARSTIRSSSGCWTPRAMPAGSAASTSPRPRPRPASAGSPLTPKAPPEPRHRRSSHA